MLMLRKTEEVKDAGKIHMESCVNLSSLIISEGTLTFGLELHYGFGKWNTHNVLAADVDYRVMKSFPD